MIDRQEALNRLPHILIPFLTAVLCVPLWLCGDFFAATAALIIAIISFLFSHHLVGEIERARQQKCFLDQQLIQSQKLAAIGELSSGIAHEINNPLAIIGQEVELMRHLLNADPQCEFKGKDDLQDSMQEIARQVERCGEITHKLLDFARKKDPLIQAVDINRLVEDMTRLVEREASSNNIAITRNYQRDLPFVRTDAPLVRQVVLNLLNNATYAIQKDGTITIDTRLLDGKSVDIAVSDTGCGIPPNDLGRIFDPFFTTKPPGKGTGLGLSICHSIIAKLGGRILVDTEPGKGTCFTIRLPAV